MKRLTTILCSLVPAIGFSQDTLLFENFDVDPTANYALVSNGNDATWVDFDVDGFQDGSPNGRPGNWYWSTEGFSTVDLTGCLISNSWFTAPAKALNYLITPPFYIANSSAVLSWKSAPYQTPLYLDGYRVLVSTSTNFEASFTDTLFVAGEFTGGSPVNDSTFSNYTFTNGFIHGEDGSYIEYVDNSSRFLGVLRPFTASLAAYAGQTIYIAFLHDSFDDNLISIDDILISGTGLLGINNQATETRLTVSPNPSSGMVRVNYNLPGTAQVTAKIFDEKGALVKSIEQGMQIAGDQQITLNISDLANGKYTLQVIAGKKYTKTSFIVSR